MAENHAHTDGGAGSRFLLIGSRLEKEKKNKIF